MFKDLVQSELKLSEADVPYSKHSLSTASQIRNAYFDMETELLYEERYSGMEPPFLYTWLYLTLSFKELLTAGTAVAST